MNRTRAIVASALAGLAIVAGVAIYLVQPRSYDPSFDTRVADPAYGSGGPIVLFDEGHLNTHSASEAYRPLADLIRHDGYELRVSHAALTAQALSGVSVLLTALPRGANDANDESAFTEEEIATVDRWVRE